MAISMMEHCCYRQAYDTLKDALSLLKNAAQSPKERKVSCDNAHLQALLEQANRRAANPSVYRSSVTVHVISCGETIRQDDLVDNEGPAVLKQATFVRIDEQVLELLDEFHVELHMSVILYNFAAAAICLAQNTETSVNPVPLYDGAITTLSLSADFLTGLYNECDDRIIMQNVASISELVLSLLAMVLGFRGRNEEAHSCTLKAAMFQSIASELDEFSKLLDSYCMALAAPVA